MFFDPGPPLSPYCLRFNSFLLQSFRQKFILKNFATLPKFAEWFTLKTEVQFFTDIDKIHKVSVAKINLRRQGGLGQKNMLILFERFHRCGINTFMECQNFTPFRSYGRSNVLVLWLFYSNLRGYFWHFLYFFWL